MLPSMNRMFLSLCIVAVLASPVGAQVKVREVRATPAPTTPPAAEAKERKIPMNTRVDMIDAANKTFTHVNADGKQVKFVLTPTTVIQQGEAAAKFTDIKVGDTISGSRIKVSDTEYTVVRITKFGVVVKKPKQPKP
jgi:hypothetical protein